MAAPGVSKASALEEIRTGLGIDQARTGAVGDGYHDSEMPGWAGVGIPGGQALQGVTRLADPVTEPVHPDGTVLALEPLRGRGGRAFTASGAATASSAAPGAGSPRAAGAPTADRRDRAGGGTPPGSRA